ncbi:MAG: hypothetical protein COU22_02585 [Candidatus Komeilibacteria bacterium CG10_big_fil_rev_8_21_14_0_10_41_13]|uniref:Glutamine amidotransferase type-2 domain-containing protein n=1 Tax=Candidatus Komeilibacteria bacterium CG10_big_fil_rev_8_21_14_0_10_41_13 TaxID=1974476 RepID=A0A2M6WC42_9BACT|nr:MAG: hypothetical protein COU22_02585 [Candidatus Komeilibacteria bacterium CG10_big_fil_rev_8_21_14_0_10_41_13]
MCRFLLVNTSQEENHQALLKEFIVRCRQSQEDQKDGWGLAYLSKGKLKIIKDLQPVWQSLEVESLPETDFLLLHARSALENTSVDDLNNNQPFYEQGVLYAFNGLVKKVRLKMPGRIGAHKIFNFILSKIKDLPLMEALEASVKSLSLNSGYLRALNLLLVTGEQAAVSCNYNEEPDYFTVHYGQTDDSLVISSEPLKATDQVMKSGQTLSFKLFKNINKL